MSERLEEYIGIERVAQRVGELGKQISQDLDGACEQPLVLVGVLKGCFVFFADLLRAIDLPTNVAFLGVSSYGGATKSSGAVRLTLDLTMDIADRDVVIVEDIVDTGMTLNHIIDYLNTKHPASIKVCTLLDKRARRIVNVPIEYVGFETPDEFVVGYGLDFRQRFRNLAFIAVLKHELLP